MDTKALRQKILDLAICGKLVPQDPNDEPASVLLERIREQKQQMVKEGKLKKKDIKNDSVIFVGEDNLHYEKFADGSVKCIEDEIPFELPEGWAWARLNQIYNFIDYRGATPNKISSGVPLITAKNVKYGYIDYTVDEYISEEEYWERQQRGTSRLGDILFTTEAPLGNAAIANIDKFSAGQRLITFQHYGNCTLNNTTFLYFILSDVFQNQLHTRKTGSTVAGIKAAILKTLVLPVPPLKEQETICNACENLLTLAGRIARDKQDILSIVSKTKAKILDLAIRGQLVPQNPDDEPASVLLERIRAEKEELIKQGKIKRDKKESIIFKGADNSYYEKIGSEVHCIDEEIPFEIPKTWEWLRLQNCCVKEIKRGKSPKYATESSDTLVFAQKCNTKYNGIDIGLAQYLDESTLGKYPTDEYMQNGDIVINSTGTGTLGRVGLYQSSDNIKSIDIVPDSHVTVVRSYNEVDSFYLYAFMKSNQSELEKKGEGSTNQKELKPITLKEMLVPIPSIREQERISLAIQKAFSMINTIEKSLS